MDGTTGRCCLCYAPRNIVKNSLELLSRTAVLNNISNKNTAVFRRCFAGQHTSNLSLLEPL